MLYITTIYIIVAVDKTNVYKATFAYSYTCKEKGLPNYVLFYTIH